MNFLVLLFCSFYIFDAESVQSKNFRNYETHYKRTSYEDADFDDYGFDDLLSEELAQNEYKVFISKGLSKYLKVTRSMKGYKKLTEGVHSVEDRLNITAPIDSRPQNIILDFVYGLSNFTIETPHVSSSVDHHKFEIRSTFSFPSVTFVGHKLVKDQLETFEYKIIALSYSNTERKKTNNDFKVHSIQNLEQIDFKDTDLYVANKPTVKNSLQEKHIKSVISSYLAKVIEFVKDGTKHYWLGTDLWFLRVKRDNILQKLAQIIEKAVETFNVAYNLPRFSFVEKKTGVNYEIINGAFEVDTTVVQLSVNSVGDFDGVQITSPLEGWLKYYVVQQNCTESCHFSGHRFQILKADGRVTFTETRINDIQWSFEMKYNQTLTDNNEKNDTDHSLFDAVLENVSRIVNNKFLNFMKSFLGADYFR